jgi:hypothetical protein
MSLLCGDFEMDVIRNVIDEAVDQVDVLDFVV